MGKNISFRFKNIIMRRIFSLCFVLFSGFQAFAQPDYFYPEGGSFNPQIPTPEQFLVVPGMAPTNCF
jgi:hypothetical protein